MRYNMIIYPQRKSLEIKLNIDDGKLDFKSQMVFDPQNNVTEISISITMI